MYGCLRISKVLKPYLRTIKSAFFIAGLVASKKHVNLPPFMKSVMSYQLKKNVT